MVNTAIKALIKYGLDNKLICNDDVCFITNQILQVLHIDEYTEPTHNIDFKNLEDILSVLLENAIERGITESDNVSLDLFDTKIMGVLTDRPTHVINKFYDLYNNDPKSATDWFYKYCQDVDYIRRYRIKKDVKWVTKTPYGDLDITINLSKPEKDPKAIAAAKNAPQRGYPKCMLCKENQGYKGRINHPARQNHRIIPIKVAGEDWFFQYSPYVYYNEHSIAFNSIHTPMKIDKKAFEKMFGFIKVFPHYFIGSNADLPIVGGSILAHDHFQGGCYSFAMEKAETEEFFTIQGYESVTAGTVKWPMSVIRLSHDEKKTLIDLADLILTKWRGYTDETAFIFAETEGTPHNTITPIARKRGDKYEIDLVLRNNITTAEHPLGVYHPHTHLHHIKKENIGLIEVMGLAVLPPRLKGELAEVKKAILEGKNVSKIEGISTHGDWVNDFIKDYDEINENNIDKIIEDEVGKVFAQVLEDAGVYKRTETGKNAFKKFIESFGGSFQK